MLINCLWFSTTTSVSAKACNTGKSVKWQSGVVCLRETHPRVTGYLHMYVLLSHLEATACSVIYALAKSRIDTQEKLKERKKIVSRSASYGKVFFQVLFIMDYKVSG